MDGAMAYQLVRATDSFWNASRPRTRRRALLAGGCPAIFRCRRSAMVLGPIPARSGRTAAPNSIECLGARVRRDILLDRELRRTRGGWCTQAGTWTTPASRALRLRIGPALRQVAVPMKNRLKVLRAERNWTQAQLAVELDVTRQTINAIETQKYDPSLPLAFKIARLFGQRIEDIFSDADETAFTANPLKNPPP